MVGPRNISLIPSERRVRRIQTAFCSYHERTSVRGSSFTLHLNASARARATLMAVYESLHCPASRRRGIPSISPKSKSFSLYFPHARVMIIASSGTDFANSV